MIFKRLRTFYILFVIGSVSTPVYAQEIIYSNMTEYHSDLLAHVLSYFPEKNYYSKHTDENLPKLRAFIKMANNDGMDVMIGTSTKERESRYLPIRFPTLKGFNGWRVALVNKNTPDILANLSTKTSFRRFTPGQFHTWTDTQILESNGVKVTKVSNVEGIFKMLENNRIDYFPRSILEAHWDVSSRPQYNVAIDKHILIKYPTAYYFYVSKTNVALAKDIKTGLEYALADGSFNKIFQRFYGQALKDLALESRQIFQLDNPYLLDKTPIERKELWAQLPLK